MMPKKPRKTKKIKNLVAIWTLFWLYIGPVFSFLIGAEKATGEVLVFMNGAGEVNNGWLEPLLERIQVVNYLSCSLINQSTNQLITHVIEL